MGPEGSRERTVGGEGRGGMSLSEGIGEREEGVRRLRE